MRIAITKITVKIMLFTKDDEAEPFVLEEYIKTPIKMIARPASSQENHISL